MATIKELKVFKPNSNSKNKKHLKVCFGYNFTSQGKSLKLEKLQGPHSFFPENITTIHKKIQNIHFLKNINFDQVIVRWYPKCTSLSPHIDDKKILITPLLAFLSILMET